MAVLKVTRVEDAEAEARRQKIIIIALSSLCLVGFSYLIYDYIRITNRISFPENISQTDVVVRRLQAEGLVDSFDPTSARLVVYEKPWNSKSREERIGIITNLARYSAQQNKEKVWMLSVYGKQSSALLGELGRSGLVLQ
ncbi:MAG TPA: hypothetical protein VNL36_10695 [Bacteroidota bacterium]|nr:hypothetical protein [Bacteroidota bacterium]